MYRDNTLIPTEAIRLAALGLLASGDARYADVAGEVRRFVSRVVGPNLDVLGTSIELLRYEGLVEAVEDAEAEEDILLRITAAGRAELVTLLTSRVRTPVEGVSRLVLALKLRYLHFLSEADRRTQVDLLVEASEGEQARLADLKAHYADEPGRLAAWIDHEMAQVAARIDWLRRL